MLFSIQIGSGVDEDANIFPRAADHGVAMVAQQRPYFARLVIVVHHELLNRHTTDGTATLLAGKHGMVLLQCDAILGSEIDIACPLRVFRVSEPPLLCLARLADRLPSIKTNPVFVKG